MDRGGVGKAQKHGCVLTLVSCGNAGLAMPKTCYLAMGLNPRAN